MPMNNYQTIIKYAYVNNNKKTKKKKTMTSIANKRVTFIAKFVCLDSNRFNRIPKRGNKNIFLYINFLK